MHFYSCKKSFKKCRNLKVYKKRNLSMERWTDENPFLDREIPVCHFGKPRDAERCMMLWIFFKRTVYTYGIGYPFQQELTAPQSILY